jgi:transposase
MRGEERRQRVMLVVFDAEQRVPKEHPLRRIKQLADAALKELSPLFDQMHRAVGRPSIPPERLLKASLLMALYMVRGERLFLRAARLQLFVPLVSGSEGGRGGFRPLDLLAQPRPAAGTRGRR